MTGPRRHSIGRCAGVMLAAFLAVVSIIPSDMLQAQTPRDSTYKVILSVGGGISRDLGASSNVQAPGNDYDAGGFGGTVRLMWHPDHLLLAGLETGYFRISKLVLSSDTAADSYASLNALPMLAVFAMTKHGIEVSGGLGIYRYSVLAESGRTGLRGASYSYEIGYMASAGYTFGLYRSLDASIDLKMHFIPDREITALLAQVRVSYRLLEY